MRQLCDRACKIYNVKEMKTITYTLTVDIRSSKVVIVQKADDYENVIAIPSIFGYSIFFSVITEFYKMRVRLFDPD